MDPTPKDLKTKRHRALVRAIDEMCDQLRQEVSDPTWFEETEESLWTDEFFRGARCDPLGLNIRVMLSLSPESTRPYGSRTEMMRDVAIDRKIFTDTARWEHEHNEMWETWLRAKTPELDATESPNTPGPNKAGNEFCAAQVVPVPMTGVLRTALDEFLTKHGYAPIEG